MNGLCSSALVRDEIPPNCKLEYRLNELCSLASICAHIDQNPLRITVNKFVFLSFFFKCWNWTQNCFLILPKWVRFLLKLHTKMLLNICLTGDDFTAIFSSNIAVWINGNVAEINHFFFLVPQQMEIEISHGFIDISLLFGTKYVNNLVPVLV